MSPGQVARTKGCRTFGVLELVQNLNGFGQFFGRGRHDASKLVFHVVLKLGYHVISYLGTAKARTRRIQRLPPTLRRSTKIPSPLLRLPVLPWLNQNRSGLPNLTLTVVLRYYSLVNH